MLCSVTIGLLIFAMQSIILFIKVICSSKQKSFSFRNRIALSMNTTIERVRPARFVVLFSYHKHTQNRWRYACTSLLFTSMIFSDMHAWACYLRVWSSVVTSQLDQLHITNVLQINCSTFNYVNHMYMHAELNSRSLLWEESKCIRLSVLWAPFTSAIEQRHRNPVLVTFQIDLFPNVSMLPTFTPTCTPAKFFPLLSHSFFRLLFFLLSSQLHYIIGACFELQSWLPTVHIIYLNDA